ncbi:MAG: hypothetical protein PSV18_04705 [Methylobacter sp.]|nr:hypothetical protein [Candidatus Methylobacter titanis]
MPAEIASIKQFAFSLNPLVLLKKQIAIPSAFRIDRRQLAARRQW